MEVDKIDEGLSEEAEKLYEKIPSDGELVIDEDVDSEFNDIVGAISELQREGLIFKVKPGVLRTMEG